jgi:hypothetical protein
VVALAADFRWSARPGSSRSCSTKVGLSGGDMGAAYLLPRVVGLGRATELLMLGDTIDAATADRYGLVSKLVADDALDAAVASLAERIASGPTLALAQTKSLLTRELDMPIGSAMELDAMTQALLMTTRDQRRVPRRLQRAPPTELGRPLSVSCHGGRRDGVDKPLHRQDPLSEILESVVVMATTGLRDLRAGTTRAEVPSREGLQRPVQQPVETGRILQHQEVPDAGQRHRRNSVPGQRAGVGGRLLRVDRHRRHTRAPQPRDRGPLVGHRVPQGIQGDGRWRRGHVVDHPGDPPAPRVRAEKPTDEGARRGREVGRNGVMNASRALSSDPASSRLR